MVLSSSILRVIWECSYLGFEVEKDLKFFQFLLYYIYNFLKRV